MSEKGHQNKVSREERLAAQLRANLRRRKQAARKVKDTSKEGVMLNNQDPAKPLP